MPIYEYKCHQCGYRTNVRMKYEQYDSANPACRKCNNTSLQRVITRVRVALSDKSRLESLSNPDNFKSIDENDPKSVGKFMRNIGKQTGENLGPEFDEMVTRLESGEKPESIESDFTKT